MVKRGGWIKLTAVLGIALSAVLVVSVFPGFGSAQSKPPLGSAESFAVLAYSAITNDGPTLIYGDLGIHPGTEDEITGFPPGQVVDPGTIQAGNAVALQAKDDLTAAYNNLAGQACGSDNDLTGHDLGGMTLVPGVYCFDSSAFLTGTLTLDFQGNPDAVFIFQIGSTLITATGSSVVGINLGGGSPCNVFWQVGSSATLEATTTFVGSILALTSISMNNGATIIPGRALAQNGAVTMINNVVDIRECLPSTVTPTPGNGNGDNGDVTPTPGNGNGDNGDVTPTPGNGNGNGDNGDVTPAPGNGNGDNGDVTPTPGNGNGDNGDVTPAPGNGNGDNGDVTPAPGNGNGDKGDTTKGPITFPKTGTEGALTSDRNQFIASASLVLGIALLLAGGGAYVKATRNGHE